MGRNTARYTTRKVRLSKTMMTTTKKLTTSKALCKTESAFLSKRKKKTTERFSTFGYGRNVVSCREKSELVIITSNLRPA